MYNQAYIFVVFILYGLLTGLLFDFFRVLRKSFKTSNIITYLEDFVFWIIIGLTLLFTIFRFNDGELRSFIFIGILLGIVIYILVFSKPFMKISISIIEFVKKVVVITILQPITFIINLLKKIIFKPISFTCIKLKNISIRIKKKILNIYKKKEKKKQLLSAKSNSPSFFPYNKKDFE